MVRKILVPVLWLVALVLAACQAAPAAAPATATPMPTATPKPTLTPAPTKAAGCTVQTKLIEADPEQSSRFDPVGEDDWVKGPEDAAVTILEYSDFQ